MKTIVYIFGLCILLSGACTDRDVLDGKPGVSLPRVNNLVLEETGEKSVLLRWEIPSSLPAEIVQPVNVFIQVSQIASPTSAVPVFSIMLPDAPSEFSYEVPETGKTYHITVKLNGKTKNTDRNYSSDIYSEGQTVVYSPE